MSLPSTGPLKFSEVLTEFGDAPPKRMSDYYGLAGLPGSGTLKLSDFRGLSAAPDPVYQWLGVITIKPGKLSTSNMYGYRTNTNTSGNSREGYGSLVSVSNYTAYNYSDFSRSDTSTSPMRITGTAIFQAFTMDNFPSDLSYNQCTRVEYKVSGGSAPTSQGNMRIVNRSDPNIKYASTLWTDLHDPSTGPLNYLTTLGGLFKYCSDRNATLEFRVIYE